MTNGRLFYLLIAAAVLALAITLPTLAESAARADACLSCHLNAIREPIEAMMTSSHWNADDPAAPVVNGGCRSCHGESAEHANAPIARAPDVGFAGRRPSSAEVRVQACVNCHSTDHPRWGESAHAARGLTCGNCHKTHLDADPALTPASQSKACGSCHGAQKSGMHQITAGLANNPSCATCHDPHADTPPETQMLANDSGGCRVCHDLGQMAADKEVPTRTSQIHNVMQSPERTCIDCHRDIAHTSAAEDSESDKSD